MSDFDCTSTLGSVILVKYDVPTVLPTIKAQLKGI